MSNGPCPKCGGAMEEGFTIDRGHYDQRSVQTWVEGEPQKAFWSGIKTRGKPTYQISSWRCERCGFLENYAR